MTDFDLFNTPTAAEHSLITQLLPGDHRETGRRDGSITSGIYLWEATGLGLGFGKTLYVAGPREPESYYSWPERVGRAILKLFGLGRLLPSPVYCHADGRLVTVDPDPHVPKRPGYLLRGLQVEGVDIARLELEGGGQVLWFKTFPNVSDTGRIRPYGFDWPTGALCYHDLVLHVRHAVETPLTVTEWWTNMTPGQLDAKRTRPLRIEVPGGNQTVHFSSGMVGLSVAPCQEDV